MKEYNTTILKYLTARPITIHPIDIGINRSADVRLLEYSIRLS